MSREILTSLIGAEGVAELDASEAQIADNDARLDELIVTRDATAMPGVIYKTHTNDEEPQPEEPPASRAFVMEVAECVCEIIREHDDEIDKLRSELAATKAEIDVVKSLAKLARVKAEMRAEQENDHAPVA